MTIHILKKTSDLSKDNSTFLLQGVQGECAANSTTNVDWQFPEERWLTGGIFSTNNAGWGDRVSLQIIAKVGGNEIIVATFAKDVVVCVGSGQQFSVEVPYISLIPAGLFLRLVYTNTTNSSVGIGINLYTHLPLA